jgi:hypothetical protein
LATDEQAEAVAADATFELVSPTWPSLSDSFQLSAAVAGTNTLSELCSPTLGNLRWPVDMHLIAS